MCRYLLSISARVPHLTNIFYLSSSGSVFFRLYSPPSECTVQPSVHNYCIFVLLCHVLHDLKISLGFLISISILTFKKMLNWEPGNVSHCADWLCLCRSWYLLSAFTRRCEVRLGSPETRYSHNKLRAYLMAEISLAMSLSDKESPRKKDKIFPRWRQNYFV